MEHENPKFLDPNDDETRYCEDIGEEMYNLVNNISANIKLLSNKSKPTIKDLQIISHCKKLYDDTVMGMTIWLLKMSE